MVEDIADFERRDWIPARSARRFEPGSPNMVGIHALDASLSLLLEIGMDVVEQRVIARAQYLFELLRALPEAELVTPSQHGRFGGIVTFRMPQVDVQALFSALQARQVVCAQRAGGIRFSPHFYTSAASLDEAAVRVMEAVAGAPKRN